MSDIIVNKKVVTDQFISKFLRLNDLVLEMRFSSEADKSVLARDMLHLCREMKTEIVRSLQGA